MSPEPRAVTRYDEVTVRGAANFAPSRVLGTRKPARRWLRRGRVGSLASEPTATLTRGRDPG